jgi:hypothetical protein
VDEFRFDIRKPSRAATVDLWPSFPLSRFQRQNGGFQEVDLAIAGDGEASLPALAEAVKRLIDEGRNPLTRSQ